MTYDSSMHDVIAHLARVQAVVASSHKRISNSHASKIEAWSQAQATREVLRASYDRLRAAQDRLSAPGRGFVDDHQPEPLQDRR